MAAVTIHTDIGAQENKSATEVVDIFLSGTYSTQRL